MNPWSLAAIAAAVAVFLAIQRQPYATTSAGAVADPGGGWMPGFDIDGAWMPTAEQDADTVADQLPTITEAAIVSVQAAASAIPEALGLSAPPPDQGTAARNEAAFRDMLAYAEGTAGPNGYRTLFGGGLFEGFEDHPRIYAGFTNSRGERLRTSAAGRYQFLARTWDALAKKLDLQDFGPESQDRACMELVRERGALADVRAGRFSDAVRKCAPTWASLPGAGYAQPERKLSQLVATYQSAGGTLEA